MIYPLLIRILGVESFGKVSLSIVIMQMLFLIVEYGFGYSATRLVAINRGDKEYISKSLAKIIVARLWLFIPVMLIVMCFLLIPSLYDIRNLLYISLIAVFFNIFNPNWLLQGLEMMKLMAINSLVSRGIAISFIYGYVFILNRNDIIEIAFILILPYVIYSISAMGWLVADKLVCVYIPTRKDVIGVLKDGAYFFFSTLATSTYTMLTPIILGIVAGNTAVGIFNSANMVKQALAGLIAPIIQAFYPKINILNQSDPRRARQQSISLLKWLVSFFVVISIPIVLYPDVFAEIIFGNKGAEIKDALRLMTLLPVLIVFNSIVGLLILVPQGKNNIYFRIICSGGIGCLLLIYPLSKYFDVIGAIWSLFAAEIIVALGMSLYLISLRNTRSEKK